MNKTLEGLKKSSVAELCLLFGICALLFLSPLYFGTNFGQNSVDLVPLDLYLWTQAANWPMQAANIWAGILLGLALVLYPQRLQSSWKSISQVLPWLIVLLAMIPGAFVSTEKYFVLQYTSHVLLVMSVGLVVWIMVNHRPNYRPIILSAILLGGLKSVYNGFYQYFVKFDQTLAYIEANPELVNAAMRGRAEQTLLFADFVISNSYAAHLILITGVCSFCLYSFIKSRYESHKTTVLLTVLATLPFVICLLLTKSRAGISAAVFALIFMYCLRFEGAKRIYSCVGLGVLGLVLLFVFRYVPSLVVRLEYLRVGWEILCANPWGGGIGEYRNYYLQYKTPGFEGVVLPHSASVALISQCGVSGVLAVLAILYGFIKMGRKYLSLSHPLNHFIFGGILAWLIHAQADFNFFIPGTVMTLAALLALMEIPGEDNQKEISKNKSLALNLFLFLLTCTTLFHVKELYSQYRFAVLHKTFFGSSLVDYRFLNKSSYSPNSCDYCKEPVLEDGDGICIHCDVSGNVRVYTANNISSDAEALDALMPVRSDLWKMTYEKLMTMYFSAKNKMKAGVKLDPVEVSQYLVKAESAINRVIAQEPNFGRNYIDLAIVKMNLGKPYVDTLDLLNRAIELAPDLTRAHELRIYLSREFSPLYPEDENLLKHGAQSQLALYEIALGRVIMQKRSGKKLSADAVELLNKTEIQCKKMTELTRRLKSKESLVLAIDDLEKLIKYLRDSI